MNSRQKGARGERLWRDQLRENGWDARRGQQFSGGAESPDVVCESLGWLHQEVKCVERLNIEDAMAQARRDAQGKVPMPGASKAPAWDRLEGLFEQRVAQALERMGWADPARIAKLEQRIAELEQHLSAKAPARKTATKAATPRKPRNG